MSDWTNTIFTGDCLERLQELPDESIHAGVSDPPYGLAFMGRDWDDFEPREYQEWCTEWATEVKRVLKPGGHLLAFSGNRTHHRLFTGVEDAGFEIRDTITWHYGSGFPKGTDMSRVIDRRRGTFEDRTVTDAKEFPDHTGAGYNTDDGQMTYEYSEAEHPDAKKWDGWKTGLKPATEYVVVARKPFDGATVDAVLEHGTGAMNIGECRIDSVSESEAWEGSDGYNETGEILPNELDTQNSGLSTEGRYPSNVVFHYDEAEQLDQQVGELDGGAHTTQGGSDGQNVYGEYRYDDPDERRETDSGGPSRYFYTSKASRSERTEDGMLENDHPTVKPVDLMEWLVKLVTRRDQIVLDPFAGSGTTLKAAKKNGRQFVGIEQQPKWADLARARTGIDMKEPGRFNEDGQRTVGEF